MRRETIADLLLDRVGDDRIGLATRERSWTWDEVVRESAVRAELARSLPAEGPFHIGVLLDNVAEYVLWLGAAALCGASIVGINPTKRGSSLEQEVAHTDCRMVVTDRAGAELLDGLDIGVPRERFLLVDEDDYRERLREHPGEPRRDPSITARTQMLLLFTSGTTGDSKAARCSQGRLAGLGYANSEKYDVAEDDVAYCCMPLFHGNALMALWAPVLAAGARVALTPKFSASGFLPDVRYFGATYFSYVGKAIAYVLSVAEQPDDGDNTLTHAFGTESSPEDQAEFLRRFGCRLMENYGSSESAGMIRKVADTPPTALGRPARPGIKVVDPETLKARPPAIVDGYGRITNGEDAVGELVDTEGAARFEGYYKNEAADAERVRHGWYWTGDLGYFDEEGFLYFAGRSGDWVRVDGENTSALLTERVLRRHPKVLAAAVFGVPDPRSGDLMMAAIEIPEGTGFADLGLGGFLMDQPDLGTKGAPHFVRVSHALPATGSNKLRKKEMRLRGWGVDDDVHRRVGRGPIEYALMTEGDKEALREEFHANGRGRFLSPVAGSGVSTSGSA